MLSGIKCATWDYEGGRHTRRIKENLTLEYLERGQAGCCNRHIVVELIRKSGVMIVSRD